MLTHPPPLTAADSVPVVVTVEKDSGPLTDASGSITTGGVSQVGLAANDDRKYVRIQNVDEDNDLWVKEGSAASADSGSTLLLPRSGALVYEQGFLATQAIHVFGAVTGGKFTIKWA